MIVTELPFNPLEEVATESEQMGQARSPGLHLSTVYSDIESQWKKHRAIEDDERQAYMSGGFLWEHAFSRGFAQSLVSDNLQRPPELYLDGIIGSPDLIDYRRGVSADTKFTWKSMRKLESMERHLWPWLAQQKGYLKMMQEARLAERGGGGVSELYCFFVNGDYAPPVPRARKLRLEFDQLEIDENWQMIVRHARQKGML